MYSKEGAKDYNATKNRNKDILPCTCQKNQYMLVPRPLHLGMRLPAQF